MYLSYFGLVERPFSIAPDPQYLYMSAKHKEAMAHLSYGLTQGGCFIVLTGEVGTGKTTLCRNLLSDLPDNVDVALILNANINEDELLETICDEFKIAYQENSSQKKLLDSINEYLLRTFAENRHTVLIIDEAQLLSPSVLEQIRLLTNLETTKSKLLQIILIGQPELNEVLARNDLRQLAQRVTARYHLPAIGKDEIQDYVSFRLGVAGCKKHLFSAQALRQLHSQSEGIPRKINVLADHALLATYAKSQLMVDAKTVKQAAKEVFIPNAGEGARRPVTPIWRLAAALVTLNLLAWWLWGSGEQQSVSIESSEVLNQQGTPKPISDDSNKDLAQLESNGESSKGIQESKEDDFNKLVQGESNEPSSDVDVFSAESDAQPRLPEQEVDVVATETQSITTILKPEGVKPGSVVISEDFLDDSPATQEIQSVIETVATPERPSYLSDTPFAKVLEVSADRTGRVAAFRNLASAWDARLPDIVSGPLCAELANQQVSCLSVSSWSSLMRLNRPAIAVIDHQGISHRIIVYQVADDVASVLVGDRTYTVPVAELKDRWTNNALVFWRPGSGGASLYALGDDSEELPRVRLQINRALSKLEMPLLDSIDASNFDEDLQSKTRQLQLKFGILADGRIGSETYLLLNEIVSPDEVPVLVNRIEQNI